MIKMEFTQFLRPELLIVVAALVFIGMILKSIPQIRDELIPVILTIFGIMLATLVIGKFSVDSVLQGLIASACAVYGNQIVKQGMKLNKEINSEIIKVQDTTYKDANTPQKQEEMKPPNIVN